MTEPVQFSPKPGAMHFASPPAVGSLRHHGDGDDAATSARHVRHVSFASHVDERTMSPRPESTPVSLLHRDLMLSGEHSTAQRVKDHLTAGRAPCDPAYIDEFVRYLRRRKNNPGTCAFIVLSFVSAVENGLIKPPVSLESCSDEVWHTYNQQIQRVLFQ
eukprot:m.15923 g.15923  ORF g.15923 m.15923 type:complete len:160 (-) comp5121_c0_seq1:456-935(-)